MIARYENVDPITGLKLQSQELYNNIIANMDDISNTLLSEIQAILSSLIDLPPLPETVLKLTLGVLYSKITYSTSTWTMGKNASNQLVLLKNGVVQKTIQEKLNTDLVWVMRAAVYEDFAYIEYYNTVTHESYGGVQLTTGYIYPLTVTVVNP